MLYMEAAGEGSVQEECLGIMSRLPFAVYIEI